MALVEWAINGTMTNHICCQTFCIVLQLGGSSPFTKSDRSGKNTSKSKVICDNRVSQRLLPGAIAAYEAGQTINFGSINVTAQGLTLEDEPQILPWERFVAIENFNGYLISIKEGKYASTWQKIEVASMLNLCIFLPLIDYIEKSLRAHPQQNDDENTTSPRSLAPPSEWSVYEQDAL